MLSGEATNTNFIVFGLTRPGSNPQSTAPKTDMLIQPTISLEMPVPSQGHYGFHSFPVVD
jgi:hypothetical protein